MPNRIVLLFLTLACLPWSPAASQAQYSYSSHYKKSARPGGPVVGDNVRSYLFDKYYKTNRAISPYANMQRGRSGIGYQAYVRPEQQRRQSFDRGLNQYIKQKKQQGNVGHTDYGFALQMLHGVPSAGSIPKIPAKKRKPSPYYNNWYGR